MRLLARLVLWAVALSLVAAVATFLVYRHRSLPIVEGTMQVAGLTAPVEVVRDAESIPHIYAKNDDDAWFALGFVHAQDRLWQMEINRRTAAGRLAEVLGKGALETDRFLRTLGVSRNAEAIAAQLDERTRRSLARYAAGVNANLAERRNRGRLALPPEFLITGAPLPEAWKPADSVAWTTMMAWDLSTNWGTELMRMRLAQRLTKQQLDQLLPPYPGNPRTLPDGTLAEPLADAALETADYVAFYRSLALVPPPAGASSGGGPITAQVDSGATDPPASLRFADALLVAGTPVEGKGSNNWVISGARTASGKPMLANDTHLALTAPSTWYLAHVSAAGLDVVGATLPGIPFVVIGRNQRIGWGMTNTGPDTQDLYVEELREADGIVEARTPDGWKPLETRSEVIRVKDGPDVPLTVRASRHGPLVSDVSRTAIDAVRSIGPRRYAIAFQWAALRPDDKTMQAGFAIDRATDWASFLVAAHDFHAPQQNIVYADVDGNIGFAAPGRVPLRKRDNDFGGQAPAPGWDARYDWDGFVPFEQLPQRLNPPEGRIVTANHKVVPDDYRPFITSEWAAPFRARRIEELLDATPKHDAASFARIQGDVKSLYAARVLPLLLKTPAGSDAAREVLARLSVWDGTMAADRPEPLIYAAWMRELTRLVMRDELGNDLFADYWEQRSVFMLDVLTDRNGAGRWCDDVTTPAAETCDSMKTRALELALADLSKRIGPDRSQWRWDQLHPAEAEHRPFARVPPLDRIFNVRTAVGGDSHTIDVAGYTIRNAEGPFVAHHGPSLREIVDFADLEQSRFIQSTGQSGNRLSSRYTSFAQRWGAVESVPMRMQRATVEEGAIGVLRMTP